MQMAWWKHGLQFNFRIHPLGLCLAIGYAFAYWSARQLSLDQFYLPAGVRVAALLLSPPRFWPYLLLGEYFYFGVARYPLVDKHGITWVILGSALLMPTVMLIMSTCHRFLAATTELWLMCVAGASTIAVTGLNLLLAHLFWPTPPAASLGTDLVRFLVGDFIGVLTIAPLALLWVKRKASAPPRRELLVPTSIALVLMAIIGFAAVWIPTESGSEKTSMLLLLALPAIALTCMHGWQGAAVGVPIWSLAVRLTMPASGMADSFDPAAFSVQQNLAVVGGALLAVGACLSHHYRQSKASQLDSERALSHTRSAFISAEQDLRTRALDIRQLEESFDASLCSVAEGLRVDGHEALAGGLLKVTTLHSRKVREQVTMVYPTSLEHVGLYLALQIGGINEVWKSTERVAAHQLLGDPCRLSIDLQLSAYRLIQDAATLLLQKEPGQIRIRARCGSAKGNTGILITVGTVDAGHGLSTCTERLAVEQLSGRATAYGGTVGCRGNRIRMLLIEPGTEEVRWKNWA
ncbi:MASE1 domain-containing protein [uncultured Stenotrophomonas sp.]|uniref:MASE1 domain-containing protein n=1 Tax=uncultured Stenotrophomonas sp. TaxID=165438 RepID=UPI0028E3625E|nr:MASE1 domain-containing protein [uncultured Stenotrophomonas sp.]